MMVKCKLLILFAFVVLLLGLFVSHVRHEQILPTTTFLSNEEELNRQSTSNWTVDAVFRGGSRSWRPLAVAEVAAFFASQATVEPSGDIYAFGVYTGDSLIALASAPLFSSVCKQCSLLLFDSFNGLPRIDTVDKQIVKYVEGAYSARSALQTASVDEAVAMVQRHIASDPNVPSDIISRTHFIVGFYADLLHSSLPVEAMRSALLVDFDCDLYQSTIEAYIFLLEHKKLVRNTFVAYDDWYIAVNSEGKGDVQYWSRGEPRAHAEASRRYLIEFRLFAVIIKQKDSQLRTINVFNSNSTKAIYEFKHIWHVPLFIIASIGNVSRLF